MLFSNDITTIILMIPILLFSISLHEYAHAFMAYKLGDRSQKLYGRLTLDPLAHMDIMGFLAMIFIGFGWGKPVYVDDSRFKNRSKYNMFVALAGPVSNLILAVVLTIVLKLLGIFGVVGMLGNSGTIGATILLVIQMAISFNVILAIFNMLPIPPFDGSKILRYFLPLNARRKYDMLLTNQVYMMVLLAVLIFTDITSLVISPIYSFVIDLLNMFLML